MAQARREVRLGWSTMRGLEISIMPTRSSKMCEKKFFWSWMMRVFVTATEARLAKAESRPMSSGV